MKKGKKISISDVYTIKASGNSDRTIADGVKIKDLPSKSYLEKVEIFRRRIQEWFFDTMKPLIKQTTSNFVLTATSCILIDLFSQYRYGKEHSSRSLYVKFFKEYLSEQNHKIDPPIKSCNYNFKQKKWEEVKISTVADGFYHGFRCGVLHSARIVEYGRINWDYESEIIKILEWDLCKNTNEINVHAPALFLKLEKIFYEYIKELEEEKNEECKINFLKRYNFEYGIIEPYKGKNLMVNS
jgi:hypothetical protein